MKTLNWRHTDWNARNFIFSLGKEIVGKLTFISAWSIDAVYTDSDTKIMFKQNNFWEGNIIISKDHQIIGKIESGLLGKQSIKLRTGERFLLSSNFWGRNVYWKNERGEEIIKYQQATMSSMGRGLIISKNTLTTETEKLLISSGLFLRQIIQKRIILIIAVVVPILMIGRR